MRNRSTAIESLESRRLLAAALPTASIEPPPEAIVRGNVFRDLNRNGLRETNEPGQGNVRVYLDYNNNGLRDGDAEPLAVTNSLGGFAFEHARAPETIRVRLLLTGTAFEQTRPANNAARVVTTTVGGNHEVESFGVAEKVTPPPAVTVLTGIVYTDKDRDGTRDVGETGRPNVSVYVDTNNNGSREDGEPLTKTNAEGRYYFERITDGTKTLRLLLAGTNLEQTQPSNGAPVTATVIDGKVNQADLFGVAEKVVPPPVVTLLTGIVYTDKDRDGTRDTGETGRANVAVYVDTNNNGAREDGEPLTRTNVEGRYYFERLTAGSKTLRLLLAGTNLEQTQPANGAPVVATVITGQTTQANPFGVAEKIVTPPVVTVLTGIVYTDRDRDGTRDVGEPGRANVSVYLDTNNNGSREDGERLVKTNVEGRYRFENVDAGSKVIRLLLTGTNLEQTQPSNGAPVLATVVAGQTVQANPFGVAEKIVTPPATAIVTGNVFYDANGNAQRDEGERGRANVKVYLDLDNDSVRDADEPSVISNTLGQYRFEKAPVRSELRIRLDLTGTALLQTLPTGNGARVITTVAGQTYVDQNFGVRERPATTGIIRGRVFNDLDRDGKPDAGEAGVSGRSVYLDVNRSGFRDAGDPQTLTNAEGRYVFNVAPGEYHVRLYRGDLTQTSPPNNGSNIAVVTAGGVAADKDFGTYRTPVMVSAKATLSRGDRSIVSDVLA